MHCSLQNERCKYSNLKELSSINRDRIYSAKRLRESLEGQNEHTQQCQLILEEIDPGKHGIHASRSLLNESSMTSSRPKRAKTSYGCSSSNIYPKECNFCKKYRIMKNNKIHTPKTICTENAVQTVKDAAKSKEDQTLYFEIKDADLISNEFKYHESCYKEYTRKEKSSVKNVENERSLG